MSSISKLEEVKHHYKNYMMDELELTEDELELFSKYKKEVRKEINKKNNYKMVCECGLEILKNNKNNHLKSKIHFTNLKIIQKIKDELNNNN
jgi:hypothetical protein